MLDFSAIMGIKQHWDTFKANHTKVPEFLQNVSSKGYCENQEIAIAIRYPDGTEYKTGVRLRQSDLAFINAIRTLFKSV